MLIEVSNEAGRKPPEEGGHKREGAEQQVIDAAIGSGAVLSRHRDPAFTNAMSEYHIKPPEGFLAANKAGCGADPLKPTQADRDCALEIDILQPADSITHGKGVHWYSRTAQIWTGKLGQDTWYQNEMLGLR